MTPPRAATVAAPRPAPSPAAGGVTYVVGHRNPDADAMCSAIAYAALKEAKGETGFVAARCGNSNARIDTILSRFRVPLPHYLSDVSPRVRDVMTNEVVHVNDQATCAEALELIDRHQVRVLPVANARRKPVGLISLAQLGGVFIPRVSEPRLMRQVHSSLAAIARALKGQAIHLVDAERVEDLFVRLGTMDIRSFWSISVRESIPAEQSITIVGDRGDVQRRAIDLGIRALVVTSGLPIEPEVEAAARERGVSIISSPYDSATTAWVVRTASSLERVIDRSFLTVDADTRVADARKQFGLSTQAVLVTDDEGRLAGILTKSDILKPVRTRLVLVDHNELTQAVPGAEEVTIVEIIDHHRLGSLNTAQPILFINEPVGSTCTIVAELFRRDGLQPSPAIAGIMMSGLISDTLHLQGPTTTGKDALMLAWLGEIAGVDSKRLAEEIFNSGSVILAQKPDKVVRSDFKVYEEEGVRFSVSQVEELGFGNFEANAKGIARAMQELRDDERLAFAALLVTDINTQNSLLLVKGENAFLEHIRYARRELDDLFDLPGVVSRKKQLIPYLTTVIKEMAAEGGLSAGKSTSPFGRRRAAR